MFLTTKQGKDQTIDVSKYINILYSMLNNNGVVSFNHLGNNIYSYPPYNILSEKFLRNLFMIDIESTNSILYAARGHVPSQISTESLRDYEAQHLLPYSYYFNKLNKI